MIRREFLKRSAIVGMGVASTSILVGNSGMYYSASRRKLHRILNSKGIDVGTLPVIRAFAGNQVDHVSPFVLLDEFGPVNLQPGSDPLRVNAHPHAGVTPTTYFLQGSGHHKDSLDYDFQIKKGDFMMFNSGKGAIHMEESGQQLYEEGGSYHGFQIWLNTPSKHKFMEPTTLVKNESDMGLIENDQYWAQVVIGQLFDTKSSIETFTPAFYYHMKMKPDGRIDIPTDPTHNAFIYLINGELELDGAKKLKKHQLALYQRGESILNVYSEHQSEFLVMGGEPLNETVFSYGPFVMNNEQQIRQCIKNYQSGLMGNPDIVNR